MGTGGSVTSIHTPQPVLVCREVLHASAGAFVSSDSVVSFFLDLLREKMESANN